MAQKKDAIQHEAKSHYMTKLAALIEAGLIPEEIGVHHLIVRHDRWCRHWSGQPCDCQPEFWIEGRRLA